MADFDDVTGALIIRPGDTLIMRTAAISRKELNELSDLIRSRLPEDVQLLVLAGVEGMAVYRPDPEPKPPADTSWLETKNA